MGLDAKRLGQNAIVHAASGHHIQGGAFLGRREENDLKAATIGQGDSFVEVALTAQRIEST